MFILGTVLTTGLAVSKIKFIGPGKHYDYEEILNLFGKIKIKKSDRGYRGDTWVLYEENGHYGYLCFGWGSCTSCDALQSCDTQKELDSLIESMEKSIRWFETKNDCIAWFKSHDWDGDYTNPKKFVRMVFLELEK